MTLADNPPTLASNNLESSSTKYPHPGTASQPASPGSQRFERCVRRDISLVQYSFRLMPSHRSFLKKRCSLAQLEHEPPHKATHATIPITGRRRSKPIIPSSIKSSANVQVKIVSDDQLSNRKKKTSGPTLITAFLSEPYQRWVQPV